MLKTFRLLVFLLFVTFLSMGTQVYAQNDYEKNVNEFLENPEKEFFTHELIVNNDLASEIDNLVSGKVSWNKLDKAIKDNEGKLLNTVYIDDNSNDLDFKIFTGIELKELSIHLENKNMILLNLSYLSDLETLFIKGEDSLNKANIDNFDVSNLEYLRLDNVHMENLNLSNLSEFSNLRIENSKVGDLLLNELPNFSTLTLYFNEIENFSMKDITFINSFYPMNLNGNELKALEMDSLQFEDNYYLELMSNSLNTLSVINSKYLEGIGFWAHQDDEVKLQSVTLDNLPDLTYLELINSMVKELNIKELPKLTYLEILGGQLNGINLDDVVYSNLESLSLYDVGLQNIDLSPMKQLETLKLRENNLSKIDVSKLKGLKKLDVTGNKLTEINLSGLTKLRDLQISDNQITSVDLSDQKDLFQFWAYDNSITSITFLEDVLDTINVVVIYNNKINLLSKANKPIHKKLKKLLPGHNVQFGDHYQYENQKVEQIDEGSPTTKKKNSKSEKKGGQTTVTIKDPSNANKDTIRKPVDNKSISILNTQSRITFPDNIPDGTNLNIETLDSNIINGLLKETAFELAGDIFKFTIDDGINITKPFKLDLYYDSDNFPLDKWDIGIYYYNEKTQSWELQESVVNENTSLVTAYVDHFSTYAVLAKPKSDDGKKLPATATQNYNFILIGFSLFIIGLITFIIQRRIRTN